MSVINQMLRDLEDSRDSASGLTELPRTVHLVEEPPFGRASGLRYALVLTMISVAVGGWFYLRSHADREVVAPPQATALRPESAASAVAMASPVQASMSTPKPPPLPAVLPASMPSPVISAQSPGIQGTPAPTQGPASAPVPPPSDQVQGRPVDQQVVSTRKPVPKRSVTATAKPPVQQPNRSEDTFRSEFPDDTAEQIYRQGVRLHAAGQIARAQDHFERSLRLDPENGRARVLLAKIYIASGDLGQAEDLLAVGEADIEVAKLRAQLLLKRGQTGQAETVVERSLAVAGNDPGVLGVLGALRQRQGRHADAIAVYRQAAKMEPDQSKWWLGLAISLDAVERYQEALAAYQRAMIAGLPSDVVQSYVESRIGALRGSR